MIIEYKDLKKLRNEDTVYASGVFDLTHSGHFGLFKKAKELHPDLKLVIGIMGDERVKKRKGKDRPILNEQERLEMVDGNKYVDYCFLYKDTNLDIPNFYAAIKVLRPKVYVCENENKTKDPFYKNHGVKVQHIKRRGGVSTTELIERIIKTAKSR